MADTNDTSRSFKRRDPDLTRRMVDRYLQDSISNFRKLLDKQPCRGSKKGNVNKPTIGLIYVKEEYDGWKKECLNIFRSKFNVQNRKFASKNEILKALHKSAIGQPRNFKQIKYQCMQFLWFKKHDVKTLGVHALDLRLPFGEIKVLKENVELIKRQIGLEHVEILSATDPDSVAIAGHYGYMLKQSPPSPGSPTCIFLTMEDMAWRCRIKIMVKRIGTCWLRLLQATKTAVS